MPNVSWRERDILNRFKSKGMQIRCHVRRGKESVKPMRRRKTLCGSRLGKRPPSTKI